MGSQASLVVAADSGLFGNGWGLLSKPKEKLNGASWE